MADDYKLKQNVGLNFFFYRQYLQPEKFHSKKNEMKVEFKPYLPAQLIYNEYSNLKKKREES